MIIILYINVNIQLIAHESNQETVHMEVSKNIPLKPQYRNYAFFRVLAFIHILMVIIALQIFFSLFSKVILDVCIAKYLLEKPNVYRLYLVIMGTIDCLLHILKLYAVYYLLFHFVYQQPSDSNKPKEFFDFIKNYKFLFLSIIIMYCLIYAICYTKKFVKYDNTWYVVDMFKYHVVFCFFLYALFSITHMIIFWNNCYGFMWVFLIIIIGFVFLIITSVVGVIGFVRLVLNVEFHQSNNKILR